MRILAIFRGDQLNRWRDMVVFLFFIEVVYNIIMCSTW